MIFFGHIGITLLFALLVFGMLKVKIDYRYVIAGAVLPDLIDKPIGDYLFYDTFYNGRIFAHTVLFVLVLAGIGALLEKKYRFSGVSLLALGAIAHQAEDQMWNTPQTALWPLLSWQFPSLNLPDYAGYIWYVLTHDPGAYVPEILGLAIIAGLVFWFKLYRPENLKAFVFTGHAKPATGQ